MGSGYSLWLDPDGNPISKPKGRYAASKPKDVLNNLDSLNSLGTESLRANFQIAAELSAEIATQYYTIPVTFLPGGDILMVANDVANGDWKSALIDVGCHGAGKMLVKAGSVTHVAVVIGGKNGPKIAAKHLKKLAQFPPAIRREILDSVETLWTKWRKQGVPKSIDDAFEEVYARYAPGRGLRVVGKYLQSAHDVLANPQLLRGKTLTEVRAAIGYTPRWVDDVMRHSTTHPGGGWVFREVDSAGNFTGRLIQYHHGISGVGPTGRFRGFRISLQYDCPHSIRRTTMTPEQQLRSVIESLRLVAAPAPVQLAVLPDYVSPTDEVATTFGDAYLLVPQLLRAQAIPPEAAKRMAELDAWFANMPKDGSIADPKTLETHSFWNTARQLAKAALDELGEDACSPDLSHISWID